MHLFDLDTINYLTIVQHIFKHTKRIAKYNILNFICKILHGNSISAILNVTLM
jgi:hypothetical protein